MKELFRVDSLRLGTGSVMFKWSSGCKYLATYGENRLLSLFNKHGELIDQVDLEKGEGACRCELEV